MPWVAAPVRSSMYTLDRNGKSTGTYYPGEYVDLVLRARHKDWKYRGLLLHAVDPHNRTTGSWSLPNIADFPFWHPPLCPNAILHTAADIKWYDTHSTNQILAPTSSPKTRSLSLDRGHGPTGRLAL